MIQKTVGHKRYTAATPVARLPVPKGVPHPPNCGHCAAIRGENNPAKRDDVRAKIKAAVSTPEERARRSAAVSGSLGPGYNPNGSIKAAHHRVWVARGPASVYACTICGKPAQEWALNKESPRIEYSPPTGRGQVMPYSMSIEDYDPLCKSCHRKRDAR